MREINAERSRLQGQAPKGTASAQAYRECRPRVSSRPQCRRFTAQKEILVQGASD